MAHTIGRPRTAVVDRFWAKVAVGQPDECWLWSGRLEKDGYGRIRVGGGSAPRIPVHRLSAMIHFGPFDRRAMVLHSCDVRNCCNPRHLRIGDHAENMQDRTDRARSSNQNRGKTHCAHGHPLSGDNLYLHPSGQRVCRACQSEWNITYRARLGATMNGE